MYGYIYLTTNKVNGKKYVGRHKSSTKDNSYYGSGTIIKEALKKYGKSNFINEVLEECDSKEELYAKEIYWIKKLDATNRDDFYNIDLGGPGPICVPEDVKERLRKAFSGDKNPAKRPEVREKIRQSKLGDRNAMYGKHHSDETKRKLREKNSGKNSSFYGKHPSEETRLKMRNAKLGKPSAKRRQVVIDGVEYESVTSAIKKLNMSTRKFYKLYGKVDDQ